jgi:pSer/pThr/pTyr-binding forkhead associated (FHA) protein
MSLPDIYGKRRKILMSAMAVFLILSAWAWQNLSVPPPPFIPMGPALQALSRSIQKQAAHLKLHGGLASIDEINISARNSDDIPNLQALKDDLNATLIGYPGWRLLAPAADMSQLVSQVNVLMKKGLVDPEAVLRIVEAGKLKSVYVSQARLRPVPGMLLDYEAEIRILDARGKILISAASALTPPGLSSRFLQTRRNVRSGFKTSSTLFACCFIFLIGQEFYFTLKRRRMVQGLPSAFESLERYWGNGDVMAALRLVDSCLWVLPDNNDLYAFRQRLMDWTGGDPQKFQQAQVEYKKLDLALRESQSSGKTLIPEDIDNGDRLKTLLPYHPGLKAIYNRLEGEVARLAQDKIARSNDLIEAAHRNLSENDVRAAQDNIEKALSLNPVNSRAGALRRDLEDSRKTHRLFLIPEKVGKKIIIIKADVLTIGRIETDIEIDDERISRKHLKISLMGNSVVAEDLDSTNGTKHRGEALTRSRLEDGDILNLGGAVEYQIGLFSGAAPTLETRLASDSAPVNLTVKQPQTARQLLGLVLSSKKHDVFCPIQEIPCDASDLGLMPRNGGRCRFVVSEAALLFITPGKCQVLYPGATLEYKGLSYRAREKA